MKLLDLTLPTPAENLACDEALLEACELGENDGVLRFYEPREAFVVLGYGNRVAAEVNLAACEAAGVPVLRRVSGGGTVLLGPGCLGYALVLPVAAASEFGTITGTNRLVMERNRDAIQALLGRPVEVRGHTDLTLDELKFSGNSQRRRRLSVLFHGTFLLRMDLKSLGEFLLHPSREPSYRSGRRHGDFVTNLEVPAAAVRDALSQAWGAAKLAVPPPDAAVHGLVAERYGRRQWNLGS